MSDQVLAVFDGLFEALLKRGDADQAMAGRSRRLAVRAAGRSGSEPVD